MQLVQTMVQQVQLAIEMASMVQLVQLAIEMASMVQLVQTAGTRPWSHGSNGMIVSLVKAYRPQPGSCVHKLTYGADDPDGRDGPDGRDEPEAEYDSDLQCEQ